METPLTAREAAAELDYHIHHLYRLLREGRVEGQRFGRAWMLDPAEVQRIKALQGRGGRLPRTVPKQA